jgi:hypothetical protein
LIDAKSQGLNGEEEDGVKISDLDDSSDEDELETEMLEKIIEKRTLSSLFTSLLF